MIPLLVPSLGGNARKYVDECIDTEWVSYVGSYVDKFEHLLAETVNATYAVAMNSGTSALHISLILSGVTRDDEVVMPGITFVSPANAVKYCGAFPVFIDLSETDWQMDVKKTRDFLQNECKRIDGQLINKNTGRCVKSILVVHLLGSLADIDGFAALADEFGLTLIEDGAESLGAIYKRRLLGEPLVAFPDLQRFVCTSFNGNKIITTGGGGALFVHSEDLAQRAKHLSTTAKVDSVQFKHDEVGYNYRLTNPAAALGCSQLEKLPDHLKKKSKIASLYSEKLLGKNRIELFPEMPNIQSNYWLYTVRLKDFDSIDLIRELIEKGVHVRPLWEPMTSLPFLSDCYTTGMSVGNKLQREAVCLPCSVELSEESIDDVVKLLVEAHERL